MATSPSTSSIRKKRNFKNLHLVETPLSTPGGSSASANRTGSSSLSAATSSNLAKGSSASATATTRGDSASTGTGGLPLNGPPTGLSSGGSLMANASTLPSTDPSSGANYHNKLSEQLANLELGVEYKLDLKNEDLSFLSELGSGNGGTVTKVLHEKSNTVMAKKVVFIDAKPTVRKQILRELQILHECNSPHIVSFYGAYLAEPHICMCMEYMDSG